MVDDNPYSPSQITPEARGFSLAGHMGKLLVHFAGYGLLVAFSAFLVFAAKRYFAVYAWAHQPNRAISPEQFHDAANNSNNAILIVIAVAFYFTIRGEYRPRKIIGVLTIAACVALFVHGCAHVGVRH